MEDVKHEQRIDIQKFLKKRKYTGVELGRVYVSNMYYSYRQVINGEEVTGLVKAGTIDGLYHKMMNKLKIYEDMPESEKQALQLEIMKQTEDYWNYKDTLGKWIELSLQQAKTNWQACLCSFETLNNALLFAMASEDVYQYIDGLPLIITQKQLDAQKEKRAADGLTDEQLENPVELWGFTDSPKEGHIRPLVNGYAVYTDYGLMSKKLIDENGAFRYPAAPNTLEDRRLENLLKNPKTVRKLKNARELIFDCDYFLKGYNSTLDIIYDELGVDFTDVGKINHGLGREIELYNERVKALKSQIQGTTYNVENSDELKGQKLEAIEKIFKPIDLAENKAPAPVMKQLKKDAKTFEAFIYDECNPLRNEVCLKRDGKY